MSVSISVEPREGVAGETRFTVSGRVRDQAGEPVAATKVELFVDGGKAGEALTDEEGRYSFELLFQEPGDHEVWVRATVPEAPPPGPPPPEGVYPR